MGLICINNSLGLVLYTINRQLVHKHGWRVTQKILKTNKRIAQAIKLLNHKLNKVRSTNLASMIQETRNKFCNMTKKGCCAVDRNDKEKIKYIVNSKTFSLFLKRHKE